MASFITPRYASVTQWWEWARHTENTSLFSPCSIFMCRTATLSIAARSLLVQLQLPSHRTILTATAAEECKMRSATSGTSRRTLKTYSQSRRRRGGCPHPPGGWKLRILVSAGDCNYRAALAARLLSDIKGGRSGPSQFLVATALL